MLAAERRSAIVAELETKSAVRVTVLAELFDVSEMTIRRDIDALHAEGALTRVHGGATRQRSLSAAEPGFAANSDREAEAKQLIAAAAVDLIHPGMTIALTGGTTVYQLATLLPGRGPLTVLTNSLPVADVLHGWNPRTPNSHGAIPGVHGPVHRGQDITVLMTGGERSPSEALVGPIAAATIRSLNVDACFMGVHGVHPQAGITTPNLAEADTNRAFAQQCARLVVLADSTKIGVTALAQIADLSELSCVVTAGHHADAGMTSELARQTTVVSPLTESTKDSPS